MAVGIGFKNLKYCLMDDENTETYVSEVKSLGAAISFKITPQTNTVELYADDGLSESSNVTNKYEIEVTIKDMSPEVEADILGHEVDSVNGGVITKSTDVAPFLALYGVKTFNDASEKPFWLTKVKFSIPDEENTTKDDKGEFQTFTLKGTAYVRLRDNVAKHSVLSTDANYNAVTYASKPYELPSQVAVTSVSLDKSTDSIAVGSTDTLTATIAPATATNKQLTWYSTDTSKATVDQNGVVTAVAAGTAVIAVITNDGSKTASCTVTVTDTE